MKPMTGKQVCEAWVRFKAPKSEEEVAEAAKTLWESSPDKSLMNVSALAIELGIEGVPGFEFEVVDMIGRYVNEQRAKKLAEAYPGGVR